MFKKKKRKEGRKGFWRGVGETIIDSILFFGELLGYVLKGLFKVFDIFD